ncbi:hypothetical protein OCAE111667_17535 [Occultella aeris]|uniref:Uncharacterized protein n=1 Tax=Occultella aeris TaxID=2761496 RepID=A0A7M4DHL6_9MICO|nr:hypothetical protein [Occultella aeris]VZO36409.1 hypothetical protein HALOF300_01614 [Occultella aeris]
MDIARVLEDDQLISIGHYRRLPPAERPPLLHCGGTLDNGQPCQGLVFVRALTSRVLAPHFASRNHGPGCDEAAIEHGSTDVVDDATRTPQAASSTRIIELMPTTPEPITHAEARPRSATPGHAPRTPRHEVPRLGGERRATLRAALRLLLGRGFRDGARIRWAGTEVDATRFFIHLDSVDPSEPTIRGYWGLVERAERFRRTGAVHLHSRTGALVVIHRDIADEALAAHGDLAALHGQYILALSLVRTSAAGRPYVLVTDASALATWSPPAR